VFGSGAALTLIVLSGISRQHQMTGDTTMRNSLKPILVIAILCAVLSVVTGCTHVVNRPIECAPPRSPIGKSAIAWQRVGGTRTATGKVVAPGSLEPIQGATITLAPVPTGRALQQYSDASGSFHIDSILPSRYLMSVRRLGYLAARETVLVVEDSGLVVTGSLIPYNMTLDECGLMYQRVRVPWWVRS
jgi:hypothetical protein